MTQKVERRRFPRVKDKNISIQLSGEGFNTITQSLDVSASGIYCKIAKPVPLMTRVQLALSLPLGNKSSEQETMELEGVVVRAHPVMKDGEVQHYDIAIFFNTLLPREREKLVKYIENRTE